MRSLNRVELIGHLGKDANTIFTQSGVAKTNFSVATEHSYKKGEEWVKQTEWHNVVIWRSERLAEYLNKGQQVYVEGRLQSRSYDDKDGNKRYVTEIVADNVILLGGNKDRPQRDDSVPAATRQPEAVSDEDCPF